MNDKSFTVSLGLDSKVFKIELIAFKPSGKYYSEYDVSGICQFTEDGTEQGCPYICDVIDLVEAAKKEGKLPSEFDYFISTGVPHILKAYH